MSSPVHSNPLRVVYITYVISVLLLFQYIYLKSGNLNVNHEYGSFHQSGFGGVYNVAHSIGNSLPTSHRMLQEKSVRTSIPISAVKHAIPSLHRENILNLQGHYMHDEHHSPFSSILYDRTKEELDAEQKIHEEKMKSIRAKYGAWNFKDENPIRPLPNYEKVEYKDMKNKDFPRNSWQMDENYVRNLIKEGRALIGRVREGVFAEYGWATENLNDEQKADRELQWAINIADTSSTAELGWINQAGFDMLVRKLLHAMITNDEFYYILGGHSAAAGHGNNFHQQNTMQFNHIMEPVFHKLGIRLICRNMAMGGLGTLHFALASGSLYGEKDFLLWDSSMTEKAPEDQDLFNKQAILGGERVPIIFNSHPNNLKVETGGKFWYGSFDNWSKNGFVPLTKDLDQVETLPLATKFLICDNDVKELCSDKGNPNKYHDSCWVDRNDFTPKLAQDPHVGGQASWHPGDRWHRLQSRKQIMLFLKAFDKAFDTWESGIESIFPLPESYWHVGDYYKEVQTNLSSYINGVGRNSTACEKKWMKLGLEKVCRIRVQGMTEWTPMNGEVHSIRHHLKQSESGYVPHFTREAAYHGIDLLPLSWKIPNDEVDVHAIAIATAYEPDAITSNTWIYEIEKTTDIGKMDANNKLIDDAETIEVSSEDEVKPGLGWGVTYSDRIPTGFCDGSSMSTCSRDKDSTCLLYGHNDGRTSISGNGLSGWLVVNLPQVKEGLIFAKLEWWHPRGNELEVTRGWTEVNNGQQRNLGKIIPWPDDIVIEFAINGSIVETKNKDFSLIEAMAYNQGIYPLINNDTLIEGNLPQPVELGIRIRSQSNPKDASLSITHIYYA